MSDPHDRNVMELIPSVAGEVSAIASAKAPIIYFELVPYLGLVGGNMASITLTAQRQMGVVKDNTVGGDQVVTAHLKCNLAALQSLKTAIEKIELMAAPSESSTPS